MPAIGSHGTATVDKPWDGPGAKARMANNQTASYYRKFFGWVDGSKDASKKGSYKFPHHAPVSNGVPAGPANTRACSAIIAILNGGRGGSSIPSSDRSVVHAHAARHLRDAGKDVPPLLSDDDYKHACTLEDGQWAAFIEAALPGFGRWAKAIMKIRFLEVITG